MLKLSKGSGIGAASRRRVQVSGATSSGWTLAHTSGTKQTHQKNATTARVIKVAHCSVLAACEGGRAGPSGQPALLPPHHQGWPPPAPPRRPPLLLERPQCAAVSRPGQQWACWARDATGAAAWPICCAGARMLCWARRAGHLAGRRPASWRRSGTPYGSEMKARKRSLRCATAHQ